MDAAVNATTPSDVHDLACHARGRGGEAARHRRRRRDWTRAKPRRRLAKYGPNRLPEGKTRGPFVRFLSQFNNILVYVLLGAGFTKLMLGLWIDAAIILGVVILNGLLGFIQEGRAEKALDSIRNMLSAEARTVRGGETRMIPAEQMVPGDVVLLESGDKVPADLRLTDVKNLRTEEAALTGESVPADKSVEPVSRQGDGRRSRQHGLLRHHGRVRPRDRGGRRDRERHRAGPHQPAARRRERARNAAAAPDQEVRLRHHGRHRRGERAWSSPTAGGCWGWTSSRSSRRSPASRCRSFPRACRRSSPSRSRSACSAWPSATPSSGASRPSRRSARCRASAPTRPARSR